MSFSQLLSVRIPLPFIWLVRRRDCAPLICSVSVILYSHPTTIQPMHSLSVLHYRFWLNHTHDNLVLLTDNTFHVLDMYRGGHSEDGGYHCSSFCHMTSGRMLDDPFVRHSKSSYWSDVFQSVDIFPFGSFQSDSWRLHVIPYLQRKITFETMFRFLDNVSFLIRLTHVMLIFIYYLFYDWQGSERQRWSFVWFIEFFHRDHSFIRFS